MAKTPSPAQAETCDYIVVTPVKHDDETFAAGEVISLTAKQAAALGPAVKPAKEK
jgi:hypothetical protein